MGFEDFVEPVWDAPLDLATALSHIPESATIAGMFFQAITEAAAGAGVPLKNARERYTRFKFYPQREFAEMLVEAAGIFYRPFALRQALRYLGHSAPEAMIESVVGKVMLGSVNGIPDAIEAMAKTYPINVRPCQVEVLDQSDRHCVVHMKDVGYFLDCHHVGVFEGVLKYAGAEGSVRIRSHSPTCADLLCEW